MFEEAFHVTPQKQPFGYRSENRERCRKGEAISHCGGAFRQRREEVIVLHEGEYSFDHRVLEIVGRIKRSYFAGELLADAEVPRAPTDKVICAKKTCGHSPDRLLARRLCPLQVDFNAPCQVEATLDRRRDLHR